MAAVNARLRRIQILDSIGPKKNDLSFVLR
uniref:Uncharacterized protein n=1 Tax=Arundo donax TaxID=35708 RepID=A0A0A9EJ21_ARUDO